MEENRVYNGNCEEVLKGRADNSVDLIVSDPPYGLGNNDALKMIHEEEAGGKGFMGKDWDKIPSTEALRECCRVLKPGAFSFWVFTPRQDCLTVFKYRLMKAGFDINFTSIYWAYATGFPKAMNMGKAIDKKFGNEREHVKISNNGSGAQPTKLNNHGKGDTGIGYMDGSGKTFNITKGNSEFEGSYGGFQPKPAVEVIIVAMKPLEKKSFIEQALDNGKGVTWFDDCRVPYTGDNDKEAARFGSQMDIKGGNLMEPNGVLNKDVLSSESGRFPANLLVSDDVLGVESKGGFAPVKAGSKGFGGEIWGKYKENGDNGKSFYGDKDESTSFSRYFDLDKWAQSKGVKDVFPFMIVPKPSMAEKNKGLEKTTAKIIEGRDEGQDERNVPYKLRNNVRKNTHPTVKPIKLGCYLVTLGSREGDVILDPYAGSGTFCISAEIMKRNWIAIEREEESCEIARMRIDAVEKTLF